jgi:hypothetical protein
MSRYWPVPAKHRGHANHGCSPALVQRRSCRVRVGRQGVKQRGPTRPYAPGTGAEPPPGPTLLTHLREPAPLRHPTQERYARLLHVVADRMRWLHALDQARRRAQGLSDDLRQLRRRHDGFSSGARRPSAHLQRVRGQLLHRATTEASDATLPLPGICATALSTRQKDQDVSRVAADHWLSGSVHS